MLGRLLLLFILVPIVELALLVQIGQMVGLLPTLALVLLTGFAGAALARAEGMRALAAVRSDLAAGRVPGQSVLDGLAILVGGAFLLTPGVLTDLAGFALLLVPSRRWIQRRVQKWLERQIGSGRLQVRVLGGDGWPVGGEAGGAGGAGRPGLDPRHEIEQRTKEEDSE